MTDCPGRVQSFRAYSNTIHDAPATEDTERIIKCSKTVCSSCIPAVRKEAVCLQQACGTDEFIRIPPERRARSGATSAQYALI